MICNDGRLGLIDYGNAPTLTLEQRVKITKFILALKKKDDDEIIRTFMDIGSKSKKVKKSFY
jgi:predicted unusual protein kinase regulating ubiquinone biosynthesis (AarF/ABC1/UbiB family)